MPYARATTTTRRAASEYEGVYNIFSLAIACMGAATIFFFAQYPLVHKKFRTAMTITGLVTLIACYHYFRIFDSFETARYNPAVPFNDAYRYVDWLLTVPLLLTELVLVMQLPAGETGPTCFKLGGAAALMVILGYPGEISDVNATRWVFWALAMVPFVYIVYTLFVGLKGAVESQPAEVKSLVAVARWVTVLSWCTYPIVFIIPMLASCSSSSPCNSAFTGVQVGYSIADIIAKPLMGLLVWAIAAKKSELLEGESPSAALMA